MVKLVAALILLGAGAFNKFRIGILLQQSPLVGRPALRKSRIIPIRFALCVMGNNGDWPKWT